MKHASPKKPLRVGIAGLGTVGLATISILQANKRAISQKADREIEIVAISARNKSKDRGLDLSSYRWYENALDLANDDEIDVIVEMIGGAEGTAKFLVEAALKNKKSVITANKAMLAAYGVELAALAETNGATIAFEAAVAGGIPIIKTIRESLLGNEIKRVYGILNGTCNYILSRMEEEGLDFSSCLKEAQDLGYAEAEPSFDIDGFDAAHKLSLLTSLAFGTKVDCNSVYVEGITNITPLDLKMADELGFRIKLLGVAERTTKGIEQRVHPTFVSKKSQLAQVMGVTNAVSIEAEPIGTLTLVGSGAGGGATASSIVSDIVDFARGHLISTFILPTNQMADLVRAPMQRHEGGYYLRLQVLDRPGAAAIIATRMADQGISLESILQKGQENKKDKKNSVPVILITYATNENSLREALSAIAIEGVLEGEPQVIRIER